MKAAQSYFLPPPTRWSSASEPLVSVFPGNQGRRLGSPCTSKAMVLEEDSDCRSCQSPLWSQSELLGSSVHTFQGWIKQMDLPHRHSRNQKYISSLQLLIWDWGCLDAPPPLQIKFRWDRNSTQSTVLRLSGSNSALGGESNMSKVRY